MRPWILSTSLYLSALVCVSVCVTPVVKVNSKATIMSDTVLFPFFKYSSCLALVSVWLSPSLLTYSYRHSGASLGETFADHLLYRPSAFTVSPVPVLFPS